MNFSKLADSKLGSYISALFWVLTFIMCAPLVIGYLIGRSRDWFAKLFLMAIMMSALSMAYLLVFIPMMAPMYELFPELGFDDHEIYVALAAEAILMIIGMIAYKYRIANKGREIQLGKWIFPRAAILVMTIVSVAATIDNTAGFRDPDPFRSFTRLVKQLEAEGDQEKIAAFNTKMKEIIFAVGSAQ